MNYLLGIDAGTTALKAALFDEKGRLIGKSAYSYTLSTPQPAFVEIDALLFWKNTKRAIREILQKTKINAKNIKAMAVSSQGETFILLDKEGKPLRKAISWLDSRAAKEAKLFEQKFGRKRIFHISGQHTAPPACWPAELLWIKKNEPAVLKKVYKALLVGEYLTYKLSGKFTGSISLRVSTCLYDQLKKMWDKEILKFSFLNTGQLPQILESGEVIGRIIPEAGKETGLSSETLLINGALDQHCSAIGAGNIKEGTVSESTGGALAIVATIKKLVLDPQGKVPLWHHALKDTYSFLPWGNTGGMCLEWFRDTFSPKAGFNALMNQAAKVPAGCDGLVMLPFLAGGAASPEYNPRAKGVFFGVTLTHKKPHFIRAVIESIAFMLKKNLDEIERLGIKIKEIHSTSGGAKSPLWCRIKADVCQKPIITLQEDETACLGAAILAGVGSGILPGYEKAVSAMVKIKKTFFPDKKNTKIYQKSYKTYLNLYKSLEKNFLEI